MASYGHFTTLSGLDQIDFKDYTIYDNNFYLPKNLETANLSQMKSAILGLRFKLKSVEMLDDSVIRPFLIKNIN